MKTSTTPSRLTTETNPRVLQRHVLFIGAPRKQSPQLAEDRGCEGAADPGTCRGTQTSSRRRGRTRALGWLRFLAPTPCGCATELRFLTLHLTLLDGPELVQQRVRRERFHPCRKTAASQMATACLCGCLPFFFSFSFRSLFFFSLCKQENNAVDAVTQHNRS